MVGLVNSERKNLVSIDRIITRIIFAAYEEGIISLMFVLRALVLFITTIAALYPKQIDFSKAGGGNRG